MDLLRINGGNVPPAVHCSQGYHADCGIPQLSPVLVLGILTAVSLDLSSKSGASVSQ